MAALLLAGLRVSRRLSAISAQAAQIGERQNRDHGTVAAELAALRRHVLSMNPEASTRPKPPGHFRRWMNREVAVFLVAAVGFGIWGWLWWPASEAPAKFKAQTYSAGISLVPDNLRVSEYHGPLPTGYNDRSWSDFARPEVDKLYDKSATPGTVTIDLAATYTEPFSGATPVALFFDIPANAQLQMCQGWSSDTPYMKTIPWDFRPTVERFAQNFYCEPEKRDDPPIWFVGYGPFQDLADPEQRRIRIVATAPPRTTGLTFQLRFTGIEGIGFSSTSLGAETHFPQFVQISTDETKPFRDPYSNTPSIADTPVTARYWVANADQATWEGSRPKANASQATWGYQAPDPPTDATAIFQGVVSANSDKTFFVGLLVGLSGAALLSAAQGSFAHRRSFR